MFKIGDKVVLADKSIMWADGTTYKEIVEAIVDYIEGQEIRGYRVVGSSYILNEEELELYTGEVKEEYNKRKNENKGLKERIETQRVFINQLNHDKKQLEKEKEEQQTELEKTLNKLNESRAETQEVTKEYQKELEKVLEKLEYAKEEIKEMNKTIKYAEEQIKNADNKMMQLREVNRKYYKILDAISTIIEI